MKLSFSVPLVLGSLTTVAANSIAAFSAPLSELTHSVVGKPVGPATFDDVPDTELALTACHALEVAQHEANATLTSSSPGEVTPCDRARFLAALKARAWSLQGHRATPQTLARVAADAPYAQLFADYAVPGLPVAIEPGAVDQAAAEAVPAIGECLDGANPAALARLTGVSLEKLCPAFLAQAKVPELVANDYLLRLTPAALAGRPSPEPQASELTQPPAAVRLPAGEESDFGHACALGMSAVFEVVDGSAELALFGTKRSESGIAPTFGISPDTVHHIRFVFHRPPLQMSMVPKMWALSTKST